MEKLGNYLKKNLPSLQQIVEQTLNVKLGQIAVRPLPDCLEEIEKAIYPQLELDLAELDCLIRESAKQTLLSLSQDYSKSKFPELDRKFDEWCYHFLDKYALPVMCGSLKGAVLLGAKLANSAAKLVCYFSEWGSVLAKAGDSTVYYSRNPLSMACLGEEMMWEIGVHELAHIAHARLANKSLYKNEFKSSSELNEGFVDYIATHILVAKKGKRVLDQSIAKQRPYLKKFCSYALDNNLGDIGAIINHMISIEQEISAPTFPLIELSPQQKLYLELIVRANTTVEQQNPDRREERGWYDGAMRPTSELQSILRGELVRYQETYLPPAEIEHKVKLQEEQKENMPTDCAQNRYIHNIILNSVFGRR